MFTANDLKRVILAAVLAPLILILASRLDAGVQQNAARDFMSCISLREIGVQDVTRPQATLRACAEVIARRAEDGEYVDRSGEDRTKLGGKPADDLLGCIGKFFPYTETVIVKRRLLRLCAGRTVRLFHRKPRKWNICDSEENSICPGGY